MKFLKLEDLKFHCRVEHTEEDTYLENVGTAVEEVVEKYLNRSLEDVHMEYGYIPKSILHACYLLVADMYANREATSNVARHENGIVKVLLNSYKKLGSKK